MGRDSEDTGKSDQLSVITFKRRKISLSIKGGSLPGCGRPGNFWPRMVSVMYDGCLLEDSLMKRMVSENYEGGCPFETKL